MIPFTRPAARAAMAATSDLIVADGRSREIAELVHGAAAPVLMVRDPEPLRTITAALAGETLGTLHIVAHGHAGGWTMGGGWVDAQRLREAEHLLMQWDVERIALWTCEGGADPHLTHLLGELTGAEVLASPLPLGLDPVSQRRDWEIANPSSRATLDARTVFHPATVETWAHQLVTVTVAGLYRATVSGASDTFFGEETSSVTINTTAVSTTRVTFSQAGAQFSGNNVSGTVSYVDSNGATQTFAGLASRPIKVGGVVQGFYVWIDAAPTGGSAADTAWILSVNNTYFNANTSIGSSSDRVDSALNQLIPPNVAPAAVNDVVAFLEDNTGTGNVLTNDSDANGDTLSVTGFTIGATNYAAGATATIAGKGSLTLNANGSYTFTPVANYTGPVPDVQYTASDGTKTATAYLSISLTPVNDPPVSGNDSVTIVEDTATLLGLGDFGSYSDPEGVAIGKVKITTLATNGALQYFNGTTWVSVTQDQEITAADIGSGKLRYVPGANGSGASYATAGFQVSGGGVYSASAYTLTVNVTAVNDAPAGTDATVTFNEDASHTFTAANFGFTDATDSPANALQSVVITTLPTVGTLTFNGAAVTAGQTITAATIGQLVYTPPANANGTGYASITFQVKDDGGTVLGGQDLDASPNTITFNVTAVNDTPTAVSDAAQAVYSATVGFRTSPSGNVLTNDSDVDGNTLVASRIAAGTTLTSPTVVGAARSVTTSTTTTTDITSTEFRTYTGIRDNGAGATGIAAATYTVGTRDGVPTGTQVTVTGTGTKIFTFTQPVALAGGETLTLTPVGGGAALTYLVLAADLQPPSTTVFGVTNLVGGTAVVVGMDVTGTGIPANTKVASVVTAGTHTLVTLDKTPTSFDSNFSASDWHFASSTTTSTTTTVSDGTSVIAGTHGTLTIRPNGSYDYVVTNAAVANGSTDQFTYEVSDGAGGTSTATLTVTINTAAAAPPVAVADTAIVAERGGTANATGTGTVTGDLTPSSGAGTDTTPNTADSISVVGAASTADAALTSIVAANTTLAGRYGSLVLKADGTYTYTVTETTQVNALNTTQSLTDTFNYRITDSGGNFSSSTLTVTINGANDAPVAVADAGSATEKGGTANDTGGRNATGTVLTNDSDPDNGAALTVTTVQLGAGGPVAAGTALPGNFGTLTLDAGGSYTYVVNETAANSLAAGATDSDSFTYTVSDGTLTHTAALTITVNGANDAPVNTVPGAQTLSDFETKAITGISIADPDGNLATTGTTSLTIGSGTLTVTAGAATVTGTGTNSSPLVISGSAADVNTALGTLVYTPGTATGTDTLKIVSTDTLGLSATSFVNVTVNADGRDLTVTGSAVNEASPYVLFSVAGQAQQWVTLALGTTATGTDATLGSDLSSNLEYFNGTSWTAYSGSAVQMPGTTMLVRAAVFQDTASEGTEALKLTASNRSGEAFSANSTIRDDGAGSIFLAGNTSGVADTSGTGFPARLDDDRPLTIANIVVNEASPYAVFTVTGITGQQILLTLGNGTATDADHGTGMEYFDGAQWTAYTGGSYPTIPAGNALLVRVSIANDAAYEGAETFGIVATNTGGVEAAGTAAIMDDATGNVWLADNTTATPSTAGTAGYPVLDDDRALVITGTTANEASPYVLFSVAGVEGQSVKLTLTNSGVGATHATVGTDTAAATSLQYFNGAAWVAYDATANGGFVTVPQLGADLNSESANLLVRVAVNQDTDYEGGETLKLTAETLSGTSGSGNSTITDDGTGSVWLAGNTTITASVATDTGYPAALDDDRALSVSSPLVNEASPYAVFTVGGTIGQSVALALGNTAATTDVDAALGTDTVNGTLEYFNGTAWTAYGAAVTLAAATLLVRVGIVNDATYEGAETFTLTATAGAVSAAGTATIVDNGTGNIFLDNTTGAVQVNPTLNDDRPLSVTSPSVNEASPYAVFTVGGTVGQVVTLALGNTAATTDVDATLGTDTGTGSTSFQYLVGATWTNYTSAVTLAGASLLVRVAITNDTTYEGAETFTLTATAGVVSASGTATVRDDATGDMFPDNTTGATDGAANKDDDRSLSVSSPSVNEGSPYAIFTVGGTIGQAVSLALGNTAATTDVDATLGTDTGTGASSFQYLVGTTWTNYTGAAVTLAATSLLVRVAITNDTTYEGAETFTLTASATGVTSAVGTATIRDDGTGDIFPDNTTGATDGSAKNDDRAALTVTSPSVNEASAYAVFTVDGELADLVSLALADGGASGADYGATLHYSTDNGANWTSYAGGTVALNGTGGTLLVRTPVKPDALNEGAETFTLTATRNGVAVAGTATIRDDGTGVIYNADATLDTTTIKDDDRALSVGDIAVNEGSPYAVFTVTGVTGQQVKLALGSTAANTDVDALLGTDTANAGTGVPLQYHNGTNWVDYTANSLVAIPAGRTTLLVRTAITNDTAYEGAETFTLTATNTGGSAAIGTATLKDDGSGDIFPNNATGATDGTATKDDDRSLSVTSPSVNEDSPYAVFTVGGVVGQVVSLALGNTAATTDVDATLGTDTGTGASSFQYLVGTTWTNYTGVAVTLAGASLLVRVAITDDTTYEGAETFTLTASATGATSAVGTATVRDDGTGDIFPNNTTGATDGAATKDDDRSLSVSSPSVSEASPYAVFTVGGAVGQVVSLALGNTAATTDVDATLGADTGTGASSFQYLVGTTWTNYTGAAVTLAATSLLVRVAITNDTAYEGAETFTLTASATGVTSAVGTATIRDDGTGDIFPNNTTGATDGTATKDDDRALSVTSPSVNEDSPYAVFTVSGVVGQAVSLALGNTAATTDVDATLGIDTGTGATSFQYLVGTTWTNYTGAAVTLAATSLLVRVAITDDTTYEGAETLTLTASATGVSNAVGTATIRDDGTGDIFPNNTTGATDGTATKDDDRALSVSSPSVNEASPYAVFTVGGVVGQAVSLATTSGTAIVGTDTAAASTLQYYNGTAWATYTTAVTLASTTLLVRLGITNDTSNEGAETFTLTATAGGVSASGTATIRDDGTGDVFPNNTTGAIDPGATKNDDRPAPAPAPAPAPVGAPAPIPAPAPAPAPAPGLNADLDPRTDSGTSNTDRITGIIEPEFTINANTLLTAGGSARLLDPAGNIVGTAPVTQADVTAGRINVGTTRLDDGVYTFMAQILDSAGRVTGQVPVTVTIISDRDGVMPSVELTANGGDFNHDGILDWEQNNVAQLPLTTLADYQAGRDARHESFGAIIAGTVDAANPSGAVRLDQGAQLLNISLEAPPAPLPTNTGAVTPLINFSVTSQSGETLRDIDAALAGVQSRIVIDLPTGVVANTYLKWNAITGTWYDFLDDQRLDTMDNGATLLDLDGNGTVDRVVLTFTDGGFGDEDGLVNGTIVDPGLLALRANPVYSVLLSSGDRYYTVDAAEAGRVAVGTDNVFEGVRFDSLAAASGGRQMFANYQPFTTDWYFAADGDAMPYACYERVPGSAGFMAAAPGQPVGSQYHLYLHNGITQLMTQAEAAKLNLAAQGYDDWGVVFNTTASSAFVFDAEAYLVANKGLQAVQELVQSLASSYRHTSQAGFVEAVEQHYLAQVALVGVPHGGTATASDVNAAFGSHFLD